MLYWIQIAYQILLPPGGIILLLTAYLLYEWLRYRRKHILCSVLVAMLYFCSTGIAADLFVRPLEHTYARPAEIDGDVLLMLGSGAQQDLPDVNGLGQPSPIMAKSMWTTAQLYYQYRLPVLISGGGAHDVHISEAEIASREFRNIGIPDDMLYLEGQSRNTAENAQKSAVICREQGWHKPILIAAAMHAPRAAMQFKRQGLDVVVYPTHYRSSPGDYRFRMTSLIPSARNLDDVAMAMKEYLGILMIKIGW